MRKKIKKKFIFLNIYFAYLHFYFKIVNSKRYYGGKMGFSYRPLFKLLVDRGMKKTDLMKEVGLSSATLAKLSKGVPLSGDKIEKLCRYFHCQPGDMVEYVFDPGDKT
jgi:DNA-binding Xre family transcriptional regulator